MMRKSAVSWYLAILLSMPTSVNADVLDDAVKASKVIEFLAICSQDHAPCYNVMAMDLVSYAGQANYSEVCIPSPTPDSVYELAFNWLQTHPKTHNMYTSNGIILAFHTLYPCKK